MNEMKNQLNIDLILLSKVWSSRLSILIAWKYSLGSKYPLAIKKVCLKTNSFVKLKEYLYFSIIIVHDIIIDITLIFFIDFEEVGDLFSGKFFTLVGGWFVVHHFVELTECFRVVFIWIIWRITFLKESFEVLEIFVYRIWVLHEWNY